MNRVIRKSRQRLTLTRFGPPLQVDNRPGARVR